MTSPGTGVPIRVLHVVPGLMPGGMELTTVRLLCELADADAGMCHAVACLKGDPEISDLLPAEVDVYCLHSEPNDILLPGRLNGLIRRWRPEVIHARNWGAWPDVSVARFFTGTRAPLILSFHGLGRAGYEPRRRRWASSVLARMATHLMTVSSEARRMLIERWGWPADRTEVIPNGVDTRVFKPVGRRQQADRLMIGAVGNLRSVKNHAMLVRAAAAVAAMGVPLEVRIAGEGEERGPLSQLARSLGFSDRLKLFGHVSDVSAFLQALDVYVLSSDSEQHPNSLNEAMACGLPCIATRVGAVSELLDEGCCGAIVAPGDEQAMIRALSDLLQDPAARVKLGVAARERVCRHYALATMVEAYRRMYTRLACRKRGRM